MKQYLLNIDRQRIDQISRDVILVELKRVAEHYGLRKFTLHEFDVVSEKCKGTVVLKRFGSWDAALSATGLSLRPHRNPRRDQVPSETLLSELGRIWGQLGHRPSKTEWESSNASFSYTTYKSRFGGWLNACREYIDRSSSNTLQDGGNIEERSNESGYAKAIPKEKNRNIPLKLRLKVFQRDSFQCTICGRSPATDRDVTLHVDHIQAFSKNGRTTLENLQTLCRDCNLGKGKDQLVG